MALPTNPMHRPVRVSSFAAKQVEQEIKSLEQKVMRRLYRDNLLEKQRETLDNLSHTLERLSGWLKQWVEKVVGMPLPERLEFSFTGDDEECPIDLLTPDMVSKQLSSSATSVRELAEELQRLLADDASDVEEKHQLQVKGGEPEELEACQRCGVPRLPHHLIKRHPAAKEEAITKTGESCVCSFCLAKVAFEAPVIGFLLASDEGIVEN